jgi:DNA-binding SARP family transcriptional activator
LYLLRTFGALELTTDAGETVAGAAAQRKPLLILALAALVPGGIPRERLLRALWPGVDRSRARATLKQHLYALRRATHHPMLITGSPRLRVAADAVRVDALEFIDHVEHGRVTAAAALLRGELFEDVTAAPGDLLTEVLGEIRAAFAAKVALVRKAVASRHEAPITAPAATNSISQLGAGREVAAAARRVVRGMFALPADEVAARHRAAASIRDLLEALGTAEREGVTPAEIATLLAGTEQLWRRCDLVRQMIAAPLGEPGSLATLEWLREGGIRTADPVGRALEMHLLESPIAAQLRARANWELCRMIDLLASPDRHAPRLLLLGPRGGADLAAALPLLQQLKAHVTLSDLGDDALSVARLQLAPLGERLIAVGADAFSQLAAIAATGPFDLVLTGTLFDHLPARHATWLTEHLLPLLSPGGVLCVSSLATGDSYGPWLRHVVHWSLAERDRDDIVLLTGDVAGECAIDVTRDPAGHLWLVALEHHAARLGRGARTAA